MITKQNIFYGYLLVFLLLTNSPPMYVLIRKLKKRAIRSLYGRPFEERASNWQLNKLGCYIKMYLPIARSVLLRRRNRTMVGLLGNVLIYTGARSRISPQMVEPCKEQSNMNSNAMNVKLAYTSVFGQDT